MNFGEKLKQIRTEKNLTQPQFAEAIGIEQSYLSKLENDKSQPSADMFGAIVKSLGLAPRDVLADIDRQVLHTSLRHIPEVQQFLHGEVRRRLHDTRKYIWSAAATCLAGFALMLAANDGIFFANNQYKYQSQGVILNGESDNALDQFRQIQQLKMEAGTITPAERARILAEFEATRIKVRTVELAGNRGSVFFEAAPGGKRKFDLVDVTYVRASQNKILQYLGALLMFGGLLLVVVEWRVRKAGGGRHVAA